jgi:hypothetical protein
MEFDKIVAMKNIHKSGYFPTTSDFIKYYSYRSNFGEILAELLKSVGVSKVKISDETMVQIDLLVEYYSQVDDTFKAFEDDLISTIIANSAKFNHEGNLLLAIEEYLLYDGDIDLETSIIKEKLLNDQNVKYLIEGKYRYHYPSQFSSSAFNFTSTSRTFIDVKKQSLTLQDNYMRSKVSVYKGTNDLVYFFKFIDDFLNYITDIYKGKNESYIFGTYGDDFTAAVAVNSAAESSNYVSSDEINSESSESSLLTKRQIFLETIEGEMRSYDYISTDIISGVFKAGVTAADYAIMYPAQSAINNMLSGYGTILDYIKEKPINCDVFKTLIYTVVTLLKDQSSEAPYIYAKNIADTPVTWATGNETTSDASFYGNNEAWKAFYAYNSFVTGQRNPYYEIINNKEVDNMDEQAMLMHDYFQKGGFREQVYDLFYAETINGKSVYELLGLTKEFLELMTAPIYVTSIFQDALSYIQGFVASIMNACASIIDITLTELIKSLFYMKIIPIGKEKYSISEIHNYLVFLRTILAVFKDGTPITSISKEEFAAAAYTSLGINESSLAKMAYGAWDDKISSSIVIYSDAFAKADDGLHYTVKRCAPMFFSFVQFAIQKYKFNASAGSEIDAKVDFSKRSVIRKLLNSLTASEAYWLFSEYGISVSNINSPDFSETSELNKFNLSSKINLIFQYDHYDVSFYEAYDNTDKNVIYIEKGTSGFEACQYGSYLTACLDLFITNVNYNETALKALVFSSAGISDIDDFIMRFLPSLSTFASLVSSSGTQPTVEWCINLLDYVCNFITTHLYGSFFLNIKTKLNEMIKKYTDDFFADLGIDKLMELDVSGMLLVDLNVDATPLTNKIQTIMDAIDKMAIMSGGFELCFAGADYSNGNSYDSDSGDDSQYKKSTIQFDKEEFIPGINIDSTDYVNITSLENELQGSYVRIVYSNGAIYGVKSDGSVVVLVAPGDSYSDGVMISTYNTSTGNYPSATSSLNSNSESAITGTSGTTYGYSNDDKFEEIISTTASASVNVNYSVGSSSLRTLIGIRDIVDNIVNIQINSIVSKLNKLQSLKSDEYAKTKTNFVLINKIIAEEEKLTEELEGVKKNNRIVTSSPQVSDGIVADDEIIIADFTNEEVGLLRKYATLEATEEIVITNKLPLSNYELLTLLK